MAESPKPKPFDDVNPYGAPEKSALEQAAAIIEHALEMCAVPKDLIGEPFWMGRCLAGVHHYLTAAIQEVKKESVRTLIASALQHLEMGNRTRRSMWAIYKAARALGHYSAMPRCPRCEDDDENCEACEGQGFIGPDGQGPPRPSLEFWVDRPGEARLVPDCFMGKSEIREAIEAMRFPDGFQCGRCTTFFKCSAPGAKEAMTLHDSACNGNLRATV